MDERVYWIWSQHAFGAGSHKPWSIYKRFKGGLEEFYQGGASMWNSMSFVSEKEARQLHTFTLNQAEAMLELAEKLEQKVITPACSEYPEALRNIYNPPAVLYYRGSIPNVDETASIGVVGARKASEQGINAAMSIAYQLAISEAVVVSGGALGVDAAAHKGALRGMGKTIAVLPCGLTNGYLIENFSLREKIAETGALVTEYPADTGVSKGTFQVRNRIISGLSCGVMIIEAGEKSGTLITAKHAKEQDRDVFVLDEGYDQTAGSKALILDGAKPVRNADEILEEYRDRFKDVMSTNDDKNIYKTVKEKSAATKRQTKRKPAKEPVRVMSDSIVDEEIDDLSESARKVVLSLNQEPKHISEIEAETKISSSEILSAITELEIMGKIKAHSGSRYSL